MARWMTQFGGLGVGVTEYRGWTIEPVDGVQLGYRTSTGQPGKGRKSVGYRATHPTEHPKGKFVSTVAEGKQYIDNYEGGPLSGQLGSLEDDRDKYVAAIRNNGKRQYAKAWLAYLRGKTVAAPDREIFGVSAMGAQAVRMNLGHKDDFGHLGAFELREKFPVENGVTVITQSLPLSGTYVVEAYPNGSGFRLTSVSGKQVLAHADTVAALEKWAKKNGAKRVEFIG